MQKKLRTVAIIIHFLLFMTGGQQAHPLPEILRGENEPQPVEEVSARPAVNKPGSAQNPPTAKAAGGRERRRVTRNRPRGLASKAKRQRRRKPGRNSTAAVAAQRLFILKREYARRARRSLVVTSFCRTPAEQARAIDKNVRSYGVGYVLRVYRHSPAIREILYGYKKNRRQSQRQMTRVIEAQVARGVYVSDHLRGRAVDIRSRGRGGARLSVLRDVAREMGGKVLVEKDHYHFKLV